MHVRAEHQGQVHSAGRGKHDRVQTATQTRDEGFLGGRDPKPKACQSQGEAVRGRVD